MGVGITVLLSLSIIQLILSDSLPPTSEVPLIVVYYGLTMLNIFMSLVFSCIVLTLFHHSSSPLPHWLKVLLCEWGTKVLRMQQEWSKIKETRKQVERNEKVESNDVASKGTVVDWILEMSIPSYGTTSRLLNNNDSIDQSNENDNDCILTKKLIDEEKGGVIREEWKFASRVLNKFFMWIVVFAIISNAVYVMLRAPSGNLL